jgi:hypothetical protein
MDDCQGPNGPVGLAYCGSIDYQDSVTLYVYQRQQTCLAAVALGRGCLTHRLPGWRLAGRQLGGLMFVRDKRRLFFSNAGGTPRCFTAVGQA